MHFGTLVGCGLLAIAGAGCKSQPQDKTDERASSAPGSAPPQQAQPATTQGMKKLDLGVKADRELLLRLYANGLVDTAEEALAGEKGSDDACQSETVCHWSRNVPLPPLLGGPDARLFKNAHFGVSYTKGDSKSFTVHATLPTSKDWGLSFSCDLLDHGAYIPKKLKPGVRSVTCRLTAGRTKGAIVNFRQLGPGPAILTLRSPSRS
jgi:hypothetical protein